MCLLLRIVGQLSSAKAPESISSSNSFLQDGHNIRHPIALLVFAILYIVSRKEREHGWLLTYRHGSELPILHHGKRHSMDLLKHMNNA